MELKIPAIIPLQTVDGTATHAATSFGELVECLDIDPGILKMPQGTSQPGSSHIRLHSGKPQSITGQIGLAPAIAPDSLHI